MYIDSHAHLSFDRFDDDFNEVILRAKEAQVQSVLTIGTHLESIRACVELARTYPNYLRATAGFHPLALQDDHPQGRIELEEWIQDESVVAVGETGLDYYYQKEPEILKQQQASFARHLEWANQYNKPIIVHIRDAFDDAYGLTKDIGLKSEGIVHCFTGGKEECKRALDLGYHISISGIVTFKSAKALRDAVSYIPLDRLLIETDSPYLAPTPNRGKRNEPSFVVHTARVLAELGSYSVEDLAQATTANAERLFALPNGLSL
jgi:TatD DNase family protein